MPVTARLIASRPWLAVRQLRAYAHEFNPVASPVTSSGPWLSLAKRNLTPFTAPVKTRLKRMQYRPGPPQRLPRRYLSSHQAPSC
jgi:putative transposase